MQYWYRTAQLIDGTLSCFSTLTFFASPQSYHNNHLTISTSKQINNSPSTTMPSKRLPIYQPRSKRQTKLLLVLKVLLHIALAECIRFVLYRLIKTFPQRYWLVLVLPLCAIISNEFLRVWFMKKTKVTISTSKTINTIDTLHSKCAAASVKGAVRSRLLSSAKEGSGSTNLKRRTRLGWRGCRSWSMRRTKSLVWIDRSELIWLWEEGWIEKERDGEKDHLMFYALTLTLILEGLE